MASEPGWPGTRRGVFAAEVHGGKVLSGPASVIPIVGERAKHGGHVHVAHSVVGCQQALR